MSKDRSVKIKLPDPLYDDLFRLVSELEHKSADNKITVSDVIRDALDQYIKEKTIKSFVIRIDSDKITDDEIISLTKSLMSTIPGKKAGEYYFLSEMLLQLSGQDHDRKDKELKTYYENEESEWKQMLSDQMK